MTGVIGGTGRLGRGLNLQKLAPMLERAFGFRNLAAVALVINSPGGSPVQSALIAGRIRELAAEKDIPVFAFIEDVGASGGYWLACAADQIYANPSSVVGSIGVVSGGFGFVEMLSKLGIERRLHTSGDKKAMLDPFSPEKSSDIKHLKALQRELHNDFKEMVRERRFGKLIDDEKTLFSGAFWSGRKALELGLIDDLGAVRPVITKTFGDTVKFRTVMRRQRWFRGYEGLSLWRELEISGESLGSDFSAGLVHELEERAEWSKFGL
tara:strand:- start:4852 stop:5652 length:801 start_codon:yes stop_codon:yes gene_type:complete